MFYVYVLVDKDTGDHYIGFSDDLKRRVAEHQSQRGAKYTKTGDWHLVYYEAFASKTDALVREKKLKQNGNSRRHLLNRIAKSKETLSEK